MCVIFLDKCFVGSKGYIYKWGRGWKFMVNCVFLLFVGKGYLSFRKGSIT
jgi:hypothetical protein